jgi:1,2-diacylglycerol 3-beta-galactosyltransferase
MTDHGRLVRGVRGLGSRLTFQRALDRLSQPQPPSVIVRVISDLGLVHALRRRLRSLPPVVTVVSDLVTIHQAWVVPGVGEYTVPTPEAESILHGYGVPAARLHRLGFPIRSDLFCPGGLALTPRPVSRGGRLHVLVMGGSSGSGRIVADVRAIVATGLPVDLTVVCGKNGWVRRQLEPLAHAPAARDAAGRGLRLRLLGYTDDVPALMRAADVLVTKAGPSTAYEAVVCGLPLIFNSFLPGQEEGNREFFERAGVGYAARQPAETVALLQSFLADPGRLARRVNPALAAETCAAVGRIADFILDQT